MAQTKSGRRTAAVQSLSRLVCGAKRLGLRLSFRRFHFEGFSTTDTSKSYPPQLKLFRILSPGYLLAKAFTSSEFSRNKTQSSNTRAPMLR